MIKLSGKDVTFGVNTVSESGGRLLTKSGIRGSNLSGNRITGRHWNGHRFPAPETGCVLYPPGYPAQGSVLTDYSGNGNNGTISGATWKRLSSGLWVLSFDGATGYVNIGDTASLSGLTAITILVWVSAAELKVARIISKWVGTQLEFIFSSTALGELTVGIYGQFKNTTTFGLSLNTPTFIAVTGQSGSTSMGVFKAGVPEETVTLSVAPTAADTTSKVVIGQHESLNNTQVWNGWIGLPAIYNRILTNAEIARKFNVERHLFGV